MAILMQHAWQIQVIQKAAARDQRFVISGATSGTGAHAGVVGSMATITGSSWSITVQSKVGAVWVNSTEKIELPSRSCGSFVIYSDDYGLTPDGDFNDLVLRCTPVAVSGTTDYFVYGHVSYFQNCVFNPCFRDFVVVDTHDTLRRVLEYPVLRDYIKQVYPNKLFESSSNNDESNRPSFKPLMLPLRGDALLPQKEATVFRKEKAAAQKSKDGDDPNPENFTALSSVVINRNAAAASVVTNRVKIAEIFEGIKLHCLVDPYASALLRFVEYDRTAAELAGGPYIGTGTREILGHSITDSFGNYIFRFRRSDYQDAHELEVDAAPGESFAYQVKPDVLVQVLDPSNTSRVMYETALYSNISTCKRLNICVPKRLIGPTVNACEGQSIFQYIGETIVAKDSAGNRGGSGYVLHNSGRISGNGLKCAAWGGKLKMISCRFTDPAIRYYTVRFRRPGAAWANVTENTTLPYIPGGIHDVSINTIQNLQVDGNPAAPTPCFVNVETNSDASSWLTSINYKAFVTAGNYVGPTGHSQVEFWLECYRADGTKIADPDLEERITLYLDDTTIEVDLDPILTMAGSTLGDCALFELPARAGGGFIEDVPLEVHFKSNLDSGFLGNYYLTIGKGSTGNINLNKTGRHPGGGWSTLLNTTPFTDGGKEVGRDYSYLSTSAFATCPSFYGTVSETGADNDGEYIRIQVKPAGSWLPSDQNFCAFRLRINGYIRRTNGVTSNPNFESREVLIGIERPVI